MKLTKHVGVVLEPSERNQFDSGACTFGCMFQDSINSDYYFYYTGSSDTTWRKACIGIAKSKDGVNFFKESKPAISVGRQSLSPTVFKAVGRYWMVFAFCTDILRRRKIGIAGADAPVGPWKFVKELAHATQSWEGDSIDIGPSVARSGNEWLVYYSNVIRHGISRFLLGQQLHRQIGILKVTFPKSGEVIAEKWGKNPLAHLNGQSGTWNESLFCPGYLQLDGSHYLLPAASNYSTVNQPKQYLGVIQDSSPFFENPSRMQTLLGAEEAKAVLPARGEIAFDTPSPLLRENEIWLYYAIMDREDGIWKTALSIMEIGRNH
jgi:hypothetical protein